MATTLSQAPLWYLSRTTGITSFVLLTVTVALGVASTQRALASPSWPRFANQNLHRNTSLLASLFLLVHVISTILDSYVNIGWLSMVVPFTSDYRRVWTGLGTIAFDLLLLVIISSLVRLRLSATVWRRVHYLVYAMWPIALLHFVKTGTDAAHMRFGIWIGIAGAAVVVAAAGLRLATRSTAPSLVASLR